MMKSYFIPLVIEGNVNLTKEQVIHHYKRKCNAIGFNKIL